MTGSGNEQGKNYVNIRIIIFTCIFAFVIVVFLLRLIGLQVTDNTRYSKLASVSNYHTNIIKASRGEIYDCNGQILVSNSKKYNIIANKATLGSDNNTVNATLLTFIKLCTKNGIEIPDALPVTEDFPYELDKEYIFDDTAVKKLDKFLSNNSITDKDLNEKGLYLILCNRYKIDSSQADNVNIRKLVGLRYDMETNDFSVLNPYVILNDIDEKTRMLIREHSFELHGIEVSYTDSRVYNLGSFACHILGRTGPIYAEEAKKYIEDKGYAYNAIIGKEGIEKAFEEHLRGVDGKESLEIDEDNNVIGKTTVVEPKYGNSVRLTIDAGLQTVAERALEEQIEQARSNGAKDSVKFNGEDCKAGAVVVMNPNNAQVLVSASYPSYDMNNFSQVFSSLQNDEGRPFVNRATNGIYPPGSTFKILTAAAALDTGAITPSTTVYDKGIYRKYPTYQPKCWIYDNTGHTHGYTNVKSAIQESCNYFFYEVADRVGIETINEYANKFGLGQKTGIEVPESSGIVAGPEYRESIGLLWNPGDTLQAAIGQSDNAITPIQLCTYMSTVLNGGKRYKATLLKSVDDFETKTPIFENKPELVEQVDISQDTVNVLKSAMRQVVAEGTARNVFDGYQYDIGGKTGTSQVSGGSDTALFVGFAPFDNPEIVVAVVVENASVSMRASNVAKSVFDYYFENIYAQNQ